MLDNNAHQFNMKKVPFRYFSLARIGLRSLIVGTVLIIRMLAYVNRKCCHGPECMIFKKRKIYEQIDDYVESKAVNHLTAAITDRDRLLDFVRITDVEDVYKIREDDMRKFKETVFRQSSSHFMLQTSLKAVRCFMRYHKNRGSRLLSRNMKLVAQ
jgi:hypothetical protein